MKRVTIKQVAAKAGVSKTTISRFINGQFGNMSKETKKHIEEVIEELNYRPSRQAQSLKSKQSYLIGVVVADISNLYSSQLLKGIGGVLGERGYQMIIMDAANSIEQEKDLLEKLIDQNVDGIVLQPSTKDLSNYQSIIEHGVPVLLVDRLLEPVHWPAVVANDESAIETVMEEVTKKNYDKITLVSEHIQGISTREIRYQTLKKIALNAKIQFQLIEIAVDTNLDKQVQKLLKEKQKTVLFAANGRVLMDLLTILIEEGIDIPGQVGITGFDDWSLTLLVGPGITSIEQQSQKIGETAAEKLLNFLQNGEQIPKKNIVPSLVKKRNSI